MTADIPEPFTSPRLPPDGHEFPLHYDEKNQTVISPPPSVSNGKIHTRQGLDISREISLPCTDSYKHSLWRNDERSEKSVRDKIALFSTGGTQAIYSGVAPSLLKKMTMFKSSDNVSYNQINNPPPLTNGWTDKIEVPKKSIPEASVLAQKSLLPYHSLLDVTNHYDRRDISNKDSIRTQSITDLSHIKHYDSTARIESSTLPRKHDQKSANNLTGHPIVLTRAVSFSGTTKLHSRSQSLNDVGAQSHLFNSKTTEEARKSSLNHLIEQRKKSMSKLRGLVIPEKVMEIPPPKLVVDLPEIQSKDCPLPCVNDKIHNKTISKHIDDPIIEKHVSSLPSKTIPIMSVPPWRAEANINDLPKYSPAFKRKSLALYYGAPSSVSSVSSSLSSSREELRSCFSDVIKPSVMAIPITRNITPSKNSISSPLNHSEPKSLESITSPSMSDTSFDYVSTSSSPSLRNNYEVINKLTKHEAPAALKPQCEVRGEDESDNDSAVSSSRSSVSHGYTPPHSPMLGYHKTEGSGHHSNGGTMLKRTLSSETTASTSSNGSTLTSGSQASCSSNSSIDSRRVLKPQSVEAINRKNVLSSAKYSSGLDMKSSFLPNMNRMDNDNAYQHNEEHLDFVTLAKNISPITVIENEIIDPDNIFKVENKIPERQTPMAEDNHSHSYINNDKDLYINNNKSASLDSSHTKDSVLGNESFIPDESDGVSTKDSVDSLDSNKSINSNIEWDDKDNSSNLIKLSMENGISKYTETRTTRPVKVSPTQKSVSVNSIKKVFEKVDNFSVSNGRLKNSGLTVNTNIQHPRVSSIDSTTSDDSYIPIASTPFGSVSNLQKEQQFGSITSLASSTSLISQQELAQLIEEANHNLEDGGNSHEVIVVILHRDTPGGSIGITLAGGADYEAKEITVHKVLVGSPAERDGRIQKADRILSINGKSMKGLTHYESLAILKAPRPEVVLVVSRHKGDTPEEIISNRSTSTSSRLPRYIESKYQQSYDKSVDIKWGSLVTIEIIKDGAGLGFSLEGGKDSPFGDQPLTVKKIFTGGCAEKCGLLYAGDELLSVNNIDLSELSRIEAWALMKRLPDGKVHLNIRHPVT